MAEEFGCRRKLHDAAQIHHGDPVGELTHDAQIMRDEHVGQRQLLFEPPEQFEHLFAQGQVEGGKDFVGGDKLGAAGQSSCDTDALPLSSGEFVGAPLGHGGLETDEPETLRYARPELRATRQVVDDQRLRNGGAHAQARVQRSKGVLKDDLQVSAQRAQWPAGGRGDVGSFI